ncbi:hypothetical protein [Bradyrhizobium sp. CB2312]|uniref:hypothetical protein n=1 Tax=Bradyrhizobium sp. CB2312 TaxID=3039155 RepID=UPI0024B1E93D|nr:hypothetical protein [Bradyrhizobium sp. CB2312]WFU71193.1 hypothetical protein QA642_39130 [Bradyrhizobium sp. CB2312]
MNALKNAYQMQKIIRTAGKPDGNASNVTYPERVGNFSRAGLGSLGEAKHPIAPIASRKQSMSAPSFQANYGLASAAVSSQLIHKTDELRRNGAVFLRYCAAF